MSLKSSITEEFQRAPVAAICGVAGVVIAALSLALAWIQYPVGPASSSFFPNVTRMPAGEVALGNTFLLLAYFLAVTIPTSLLLRTIGRKHDIAAFFASIPLVSLTNFSAILVMYLAPPRPLSAQLFASAHDLVFYASAAIVICFCGTAVLRDIAASIGTTKTETVKEGGSSNSDGLGFLLIALILLAVWSWLVFAGQTRLTRTLLPEITHHVEVKPIKSGI